MRSLRPLLVAATLLGVSAPLGAQAPTDRLPWAAFLGCWSNAAAGVDARNAPMTCFVPVEGSTDVAERLTLRGETVAERSRLDASGRQVALDADACGGWESARFSGDGARVYTAGEATCGDDPVQHLSGVISIAPTGDLLFVSTLRVASQRSLRVQRLRPVAVTELPEAVQPALDPHLRRIQGARVAAAQRLAPTHVVEVASAVDEYAGEAWMVETTRDVSGFTVVRGDLERFASARVPDRLIDMAVILANPEDFRVALEQDVVATSRVQQVTSGAGFGRWAMCDRIQGSMWAMNWMTQLPLGYWGRWSTLSFPYMGMAGYSWYPECAPFGFYSRWAMSGFWVGDAGPGVFPGFGAWPVRVGVSSQRIPASGGRVVKGQGYTRQGGAGETRTASPASQSSGTTRSSGGSGSVQSSGSGGSTTGRTAKPRTP
jgi:hypothetical protein